MFMGYPKGPGICPECPRESPWVSLGSQNPPLHFEVPQFVRTLRVRIMKDWVPLAEDNKTDSTKSQEPKRL